MKEEPGADDSNTNLPNKEDKVRGLGRQVVTMVTVGIITSHSGHSDPSKEFLRCLGPTTRTSVLSETSESCSSSVFIYFYVFIIHLSYIYIYFLKAV